MPSSVATRQYYARRRRREAQDFTAYNGVVASPVDLGMDTLALPANGYIGIGSDTDLAAGDITITFGGHAIDVGALTHDAVPMRLGRFERSEEVTITQNAGPSCLVTVYVFDQWRRSYAIATRSF
jgi:hypothetical protein